MSYDQKVQSIEYFINQVLPKHSHTYLFCLSYGYIQSIMGEYLAVLLGNVTIYSIERCYAMQPKTEATTSSTQL